MMNAVLPGPIRQIGYVVRDLDQALASWLGPTTVIELMELTEATLAMAKLVRDAADEWDGSDPIHVLWNG